MAGHQYGDMICTDHSERHSELDNDEEDEDEEDEEEDDDDDEEEAEDDDFYDEEDSNIDEDFEGLSINEEREIMRYALASHDLQQYENQLRAQQQHQNQHQNQQQYSCSSDTDNGCGDNNTNSNSYDLGTCHNHHNSNSSNNSSGHSNASDSNPNLSIYNSTEKLIMDTSLFDTKMRLIGNGIVLLVSTFALLVLLPLYFQQMTTNGPRFNVFGATFLLSAAAALVFLVVTIALGVAIKWKVPFYKPPLPWTK